MGGIMRHEMAPQEQATWASVATKAGGGGAQRTDILEHQEEIATDRDSLRSCGTGGRALPGSAPARFLECAKHQAAYKTELGVMLQGNSEDVLSGLLHTARGGTQLLFTSPPFLLHRKKRYDNKQGEEFVQWLASFAPIFADVIAPEGSIVIEMGNAWLPGLPAMSTLALEALLAFKNKADLYLCQQFVCHNPARLPSPAQWVNVERSRVKDSFTHIWWLAKTPKPKANNRNVLTPYSGAMTALLRRGRYNSGRRPSEHAIGDRSFLSDNGGAIPSNVLTFSNTASNSPYLRYCREHGLPVHPARMPLGLANFFIRFLTDTGDLVLDPFAGSNTTGAAAEQAERRWVSIEASHEYVEGSYGHFAEARK